MQACTHLCGMHIPSHFHLWDAHAPTPSARWMQRVPQAGGKGNPLTEGLHRVPRTVPFGLSPRPQPSPRVGNWTSRLRCGPCWTLEEPNPRLIPGRGSRVIPPEMMCRQRQADGVLGCADASTAEPRLPNLNHQTLVGKDEKGQWSAIPPLHRSSVLPHPADPTSQGTVLQCKHPNGQATCANGPRDPVC